MKWLKLTPLLLLPTILLAGCATGSSNFQSVKIVCPITKQYSLEDQAKAAEELVEIKKKYPRITQYVADYGDLRRKVRVCEEMR